MLGQHDLNITNSRQGAKDFNKAQVDYTASYDSAATKLPNSGPPIEAEALDPIEVWAVFSDRFLRTLTRIAKRRESRVKADLMIIRACRHYRLPISAGRRIYSNLLVEMNQGGEL